MSCLNRIPEIGKRNYKNFKRNEQQNHLLTSFKSKKQKKIIPIFRLCNKPSKFKYFRLKFNHQFVKITHDVQLKMRRKNLQISQFLHMRVCQSNCIIKTSNFLEMSVNFSTQKVRKASLELGSMQFMQKLLQEFVSLKFKQKAT